MTAGGHGFDGVERRGLMFVLSSPSGAGKTTLSRMLVAETPALQMSVSATTRPMRPGEVDGKDYYFVDRNRFEAMVANGELLEWATVFDHRYGTPRAPVEAALAAGKDVLFDIDWQGTQQLRSRAASDVVSVFILPPSAADLEKRLHTRAQDSDEVIHGRMRKAADEMSRYDAYDYIVVNDNIGIAFEAVQIDPARRAAQARTAGRALRLRRRIATSARKIAEGVRPRHRGTAVRAFARSFDGDRQPRAMPGEMPSSRIDPAAIASSDSDGRWVLADSQFTRRSTMTSRPLQFNLPNLTIALPIRPATDNAPSMTISSIGTEPVGFAGAASAAARVIAAAGDGGGASED